jgi:hypothetical protein
MTDVVEIARERKVRLAAEIGKLDDFIRMAEALIKHSQSKSNKASNAEAETAMDSTDSIKLRPYSVAAGADGADAKA